MFQNLIVLQAYKSLFILCLQLDSKHEAANAYADAAHCYKKTNTKGPKLLNFLYDFTALYKIVCQSLPFRI